MKRHILLIIFATLCFPSMAQTDADITTHLNRNIKYFPPPRDLDAKTPIEPCQLCVMYDFQYLADDKSQTMLRDKFMLEVGNNTVKFYGRNAELRDSIVNDFYYKNINNLPEGINAESWLSANETALYLDIYSNLTKQERSVCHLFGNVDHRYTEPIDTYNWTVTRSVDTVSGYLCTKAIMKYRGRTWYAWFTSELPYNFGPWKLGGLPGLILKAEDADNQFVWTAIAISQPEDRMIFDFDAKKKQTKSWSSAIPRYQQKSVSGKDVNVLWQRQWLSPMSMHFVMRGMNQGVVNVSLPDGSTRRIQINLGDLEKQYYPRFELDI